MWMLPKYKVKYNDYEIDTYLYKILVKESQSKKISLHNSSVTNHIFLLYKSLCTKKTIKQ